MQVQTFLTLVTIFKDNYFSPRPLVTVPGVGRLRGTRIKSTLLGRDILGFWGVPYALSPTGKRRFQPPWPAPPLPREFDAGQWRYVISPRSCPQPGKSLPASILSSVTGAEAATSVLGTEDCLNLAVFTPDLKPRKLLPVMVFIHGGAFIIGSYTAYGPHYLLDHDVVLVHIHYRLSSLGFLCVNSKESHSNVGLLDQVMALEWVQKHIRHFGGDPRRVTLVGESAGGASVAYLVSSTKARGLFSRAISMSGSSTAQWSSNTRGLERARDLAARLSCPQGEAEEMVRCLKYERSLDQIILAQNELRLQNFAEMKSLGSESAPCPDHNFRPARSSSDISNPVPALVTSVRDEGTLFAALAVKNFFQNPVNARRISAPGYYYNQFLVDFLRLLQVPGWRDERYVNFMKRSYFQSQELGTLEGILPGLAAILGRFMIKEPGYDFARLNSERAPTYLLSFEYQGENSFFTFLAPDSAEDFVSAGITHSDDLQYLFYTGVFTLNQADQAAASRFIRVVLNFVSNGSPHPGLSPISGNSSQYLRFGDSISVQRDYTRTFWRYQAP